jgi:hypothetical protein
VERDDDLGMVFDNADYAEAAGEAAYADEVAVEQYDMLEKALTEALEKGVSVDNLRTLARETGMTQWAIQNFLVSPAQAQGWFKD